MTLPPTAPVFPPCGRAVHLRAVGLLRAAGRAHLLNDPLRQGSRHHARPSFTGKLKSFRSAALHAHQHGEDRFRESENPFREVENRDLHR